MSIEAVRRRLGHASTATNQLYALLDDKVADDEIRARAPPHPGQKLDNRTAGQRSRREVCGRRLHRDTRSRSPTLRLSVASEVLGHVCGQVGCGRGMGSTQAVGCGCHPDRAALRWCRQRRVAGTRRRAARGRPSRCPK
ncbi:hypothetical protein [Actinoplanes lutulentus]|uniref:hypothetical protein n=1 Tax=Actinoplanes lutulentus TaxID=1287878 RepID=UPI001FE39D77|nr:hypothetical protein [Actinoplanes lutulentus]